MQKLLIKSAKIPGRADNNNYDVLIDNGKIVKITLSKNKSANKNQKDTKIIDLAGKNLVPGYIDLHIQGAGGADVLDGTEEAFDKISKTCTKYGVTRFLATTVYKVGGDNRHLEVASDLTGKNLNGARLEGIHLEGPFISMNKRGMIQPSSITEPSFEVLDDIFKKTNGKLKMMTIAPELENNVEKIIKRLIKESVIVSLGHTEATYEQVKKSFDMGINHVTHIYNAMMGIHHRAPGPLIAIYENKSIISQIITDGVHIQPPVLRFTSDVLGTDRLAIITDGMRPMGLPEGEYFYEGKRYILRNGTAVYTDGTLIGTALGVSELLNRYKNFTSRSFTKILKMATEVPAKVLGLEDYCIKLKEGMDADLLLLSDNFSPEFTIVNGNVVYKK